MLGEFIFSFNRLQLHAQLYMVFLMNLYHTFHLVLFLKIKPVRFSTKC